LTKPGLCLWSATVPELYARRRPVAKAATVLIKLISTANTGFFYTTKKNTRSTTDKLSFKKYDPKVRKHVEFKESKIK
jgi:large subunit ribosomal protein L33